MTPNVSFVPEDLRIPALWLEAALAARGASASSLARLLGVEVNTVSRWRRGVAPISRSRWIAILAALALPQNFEPAPGFKPPLATKGRPRTVKPKRAKRH
jgi:transcriptional regulator with XRE-family HTH domain